MFDTKDILGFLVLCGGLAAATNMSLVNEKPKSPVNFAQKNYAFEKPSFSILDESLADEIDISDLQGLQGANIDDFERTQLRPPARKAQKLSLFEY